MYKIGFVYLIMNICTTDEKNEEEKNLLKSIKIEKSSKSLSRFKRIKKAVTPKKNRQQNTKKSVENEIEFSCSAEVVHSPIEVQQAGSDFSMIKDELLKLISCLNDCRFNRHKFSSRSTKIHVLMVFPVLVDFINDILIGLESLDSVEIERFISNYDFLHRSILDFLKSTKIFNKTSIPTISQFLEDYFKLRNNVCGMDFSFRNEQSMIKNTHKQRSIKEYIRVQYECVMHDTVSLYTNILMALSKAKKPHEIRYDKLKSYLNHKHKLFRKRKHIKNLKKIFLRRLATFTAFIYEFNYRHFISKFDSKRSFLDVNQFSYYTLMNDSKRKNIIESMKIVYRNILRSKQHEYLFSHNFFTKTLRGLINEGYERSEIRDLAKLFRFLHDFLEFFMTTHMTKMQKNEITKIDKPLYQIWSYCSESDFENFVTWNRHIYLIIREINYSLNLFAKKN